MPDPHVEEVRYSTQSEMLSDSAKQKIIQTVERSIRISNRINRLQVVYIAIEGGTLYINNTGGALRESVLG